MQVHYTPSDERFPYVEALYGLPDRDGLDVDFRGSASFVPLGHGTYARLRLLALFPTPYLGEFIEAIIALWWTDRDGLREWFDEDPKAIRAELAGGFAVYREMAGALPAPTLSQRRAMTEAELSRFESKVFHLADLFSWLFIAAKGVSWASLTPFSEYQAWFSKWDEHKKADKLRLWCWRQSPAGKLSIKKWNQSPAGKTALAKAKAKNDARRMTGDLHECQTASMPCAMETPSQSTMSPYKSSV